MALSSRLAVALAVLLLACSAADAARSPAAKRAAAKAARRRWPAPGWTAAPVEGVQPSAKAVASAAVAKGCPNPQAGVLAMHNKLRAMHRAPPLQWDAALAAKAQAHANTCVWGHSDGRTLAGSGESIYSTIGTKYPFRGMDVCTWSTYALYLEVTVYNFDKPGATHDPSVPTGHFVNIVWGNTTRIGCGYTACPGKKDYVVCWFNPGFYISGGSNPAKGITNYKGNVRRSTCQAATKDDWCSACKGATCTACYERPQYGQASGRKPIKLDPTHKRCVSACPAAVRNCSSCGYDSRCVTCAAGWQKDAKGDCTLKTARAKI